MNISNQMEIFPGVKKVREDSEYVYCSVEKEYRERAIVAGFEPPTGELMRIKAEWFYEDLEHLKNYMKQKGLNPKDYSRIADLERKK